MKAVDLVVRGYVRREEGLWVAVCLDFCLAAQADSSKQAMEDLASQIQEYVYDALVGEDKDQGRHFLLKRKAPLSQWLTYYRFRSMQALRLLREEVGQLLHLPLPVQILPPASAR